jgi:ATP-dependent DNA helicase RecG
LVEQQSARRWTYYTLKVPREVPLQDHLSEEEEKILACVREKGAINNSECRDLLNIDEGQAWYLLKKLSDAGLLSPQGKGRWRRYILP